MTGRLWGLWYYITGTDPGFIFLVRLKIESPSSVAVGPNKVLTEQGPSLPKPPSLRKGAEVPGKTGV